MSMKGVTYQVSVLAGAPNASQVSWCEWATIPNEPRFVGPAENYNWQGIKAYAENVGLPVRELDERGVVTREYYPLVEDDCGSK